MAGALGFTDVPAAPGSTGLHHRQDPGIPRPGCRRSEDSSDPLRRCHGVPLRKAPDAPGWAGGGRPRLTLSGVRHVPRSLLAGAETLFAGDVHPDIVSGPPRWAPGAADDRQTVRLLCRLRGDGLLPLRLRARACDRRNGDADRGLFRQGDDAPPCCATFSPFQPRVRFCNLDRLPAVVASSSFRDSRGARGRKAGVHARADSPILQLFRLFSDRLAPSRLDRGCVRGSGAGRFGRRIGAPAVPFSPRLGLCRAERNGDSGTASSRV